MKGVQTGHLLPNPNPNPNPNPEEMSIKRPTESSMTMMDYTLTPPRPRPPPPRFSLKAAARKLPIKRKSPHSPSFSPPTPCPYLVPKTESTAGDDTRDSGCLKTPPFKFHRIWTEPDEIRFLRGLLDCSSQGLSFPRDLHIFYSRFSLTMSQPYTKSQLSEKLRRLRKKFRVISSRLARGLHPAHLSPHDRELFDLSRRLWHPDHSSDSPFLGNLSDICGKKRKSTLVGVEVSFSPTLPWNAACHQTLRSISNGGHTLDPTDNGDNNGDDHKGVKVDGAVEVEVAKLDSPSFGAREDESGDGGGGIGWVAAKAVMDVFDQCLKEANMAFVQREALRPDGKSALGNAMDFENRWKRQRVAELDVFARRLRLVMHNSLGQGR